jgi:Asp-tRNA(Asn)/Glu-tRNA(Gln) amidotransferase A subunit family amidase
MDHFRAANRAALEGIPLAIKDLFCTAGVQTTAAAEDPRRLRAAL